MRVLWRGKVYEVRLEGRRLSVTPPDAPPRTAEVTFGEGTVTTPEGTFAVRSARDRGAVWAWAAGVAARLQIAAPGSAGTGADEVRSPMTGQVVSVSVKAGDAVKASQALAVVAAMKMEFRIESPRDGVVKAVDCAPGDRVELGATVVRLQ
ncbi:MAG TPA: biotin/lipoyl-containing protein [Planctomycetota bacterium]|nr:biotin/lipoyl-containing protein [Planctomycetota bacterium]